MRYLNETFTLNNGVTIPAVGYGTWRIYNADASVAVFKDALDVGYRHLDTAAFYENEKSLGEAIEAHEVDRDALFITSKVPSNVKTYEETIEVFNQTLADLKTDYVDLYLIHGPAPREERHDTRPYDQGNLEVWRALEDLYEQGKTRSIGVSNFAVRDLKNLLNHGRIKPMVNQIRYFIGFTQDEIVAFSKANDILIQAYSPLARTGIFEHPTVKQIANKLDVTPAQLAVRYCLEHGTLPLPKSQNKDRMKNNADVDFSIDAVSLKALDAIDFDPAKDPLPKK